MVTASQDCGDCGNFDQNSGYAEPGNPLTGDQRWFIRCQIGGDRPVRGCEVDAIDEEHRPLNDVIDTCADIFGDDSYD